LHGADVGLAKGGEIGRANDEITRLDVGHCHETDLLSMAPLIKSICESLINKM
jgi:hypothetical protein